MKTTEFIVPRPAGLTNEEIERIQKKLALITDTNNEIRKELGFTRAARVHMATFPDDILISATKLTSKWLLGEERFHSFFSYCKEYAKKTENPYDEVFHRHLLGIFKTDPNAPCSQFKTIIAPTNQRPITQGRRK